MLDKTPKFNIKHGTLEKLYDVLRNTERLDMHIPGSYVVYTRWAIWEKTGKWLPVEIVEQYLYEENLIPEQDQRSTAQELRKRGQIR